MSHNSNVFDGTIGHLQPMFIIKTTRLRCGAADGLLDKHAVFRMSSLNRQIQPRFRRRLAFKYSKGFIGPVKFSAQYVPAETACPVQSLRLCQGTLAPRAMRGPPMAPASITASSAHNPWRQF